MRRSLFLFVSVALGISLISLLAKLDAINFRLTIHQLAGVDLIAFSGLVVLTAIHVYLSHLKWVSIDAVLRRPVDSVPSSAALFMFTSVGVVLGQVLPVQVSMSGARTIGTYVHGKALTRGTVGTLFEQSFDILIVVLLAAVSAVIRLINGNGTLWIALAVAVMALAQWLVGPLVSLIRSGAPVQPIGVLGPRSRVRLLLNQVVQLKRSNLLTKALVRRLTAISVLRFLIQVLMAGLAARAIGVHIPLWHLAAAMPFVVIACIIAVTPGGLGVNELSYATALHLFGTPLSVGAQWAFANRFLVIASCLLVSGVAGAVLLGQKIVVSDKRKAHGISNV